MHTTNGCLVDPWRQHRQRPPYTLPEQRPAAARACRSPSSGAPSRSVRAAASCSAEAWPQAGTAAGRPFSLNRAAQRVANLCSWRREWPRPAAAGCVCCCDGDGSDCGAAVSGRSGSPFTTAAAAAAALLTSARRCRPSDCRSMWVGLSVKPCTQGGVQQCKTTSLRRWARAKLPPCK